MQQAFRESMRTVGKSEIDVVAQIGHGALELDRLLPSALKGREPSRMKHLEKLVDRDVANLQPNTRSLHS